MNKNTIGIAGVALVVGLIVGYVGANALRPATPAQTARGSFTGTNGGMRGGLPGQGGTGNGGFLSGAVAKEDSGSVTLNTRDGSSHVVLITPATTVQKSVNGNLSDIAVGNTIFVTGSTNSDGSVSASSIQLRPAMPSATVGQ